MPAKGYVASGALELFAGGDVDGLEELPRVLPLPAKACVPDAGLEAAYLATAEESALFLKLVTKILDQ